MHSDQIRERFLKFFEGNGHRRVPSASLIPVNDPTLLFSNAGMNQFKDLFMGRETRDYRTATSAQKCVRAGGKHNDLDNVGYTTRHHTFFEMLGNFSFGGYFKSEAIQMAWRFLTEELAIPVGKLYITVYEQDQEAYELWHDKMGIPASRIFRFGKKDNFWAMGDTGPCGPCSEIFYDYGPGVPGPEDPYEAIAAGSDRIVEVWNLVFMQYETGADGKLTPLPNPSIDTGMGLERMASVLQGCTSNYQTDLFQDIIKPLAAHLNIEPGWGETTDTALKVIADHLRAMCFLIADGVVPSNEGRGYVLRRIMRRAMRFGKQLGREAPFLYQAVVFVIDKMGGAYPELKSEGTQIELLVKVEEQQFDQTLSKGLPILVKYLDQLEKQNLKTIPGQVVHFLYGTHGFPVDLMKDIARDRGMDLDHKTFQDLMKEEAGRSQEGGDFAQKQVHPLLLEDSRHFETRQTCHEGLLGEGRIRRILADEVDRKQIEAGAKARLILDQTSFYAESGGQIGDKGQITTESGLFEVEETTKLLDKLVIHHGTMLEGTITSGQQAETRVFERQRRDAQKNHTATHLLHKALRDVLGQHVRQAGSLVDPEKLRFDFSHFAPLNAAVIEELEALVNEKILANMAVTTREMPLAEARKSGAIAFFGEKYGQRVRVVSAGDFSVEFCGGTHVAATGEIGCFKIIAEKGLAAGIRRLVALTGPVALARFQESERLLKQAQDRFFIKRDRFIEQLKQAQDDRKTLEQRVEDLKMKLAQGGVSDERIEELVDFKVIIKKVSDVGGGQLRQLADELLTRIKKGAVLLGSDLGDKAQLIVKTNQPTLHAGNLVREMAALVGGKGGGRPDMAMAGGKDATKLAEALEQGWQIIRSQ